MTEGVLDYRCPLGSGARCCYSRVRWWFPKGVSDEVSTMSWSASAGLAGKLEVMKYLSLSPLGQ